MGIFSGTVWALKTGAKIYGATWLATKILPTLNNLTKGHEVNPAVEAAMNAANIAWDKEKKVWHATGAVAWDKLLEKSPVIDQWLQESAPGSTNESSNFTIPDDKKDVIPEILSRPLLKPKGGLNEGSKHFATGLLADDDISADTLKRFSAALNGAKSTDLTTVPAADLPKAEAENAEKIAEAVKTSVDGMQDPDPAHPDPAKVLEAKKAALGNIGTMLDVLSQSPEAANEEANGGYGRSMHMAKFLVDELTKNPDMSAKDLSDALEKNREAINKEYTDWKAQNPNGIVPSSPSNSGSGSTFGESWDEYNTKWAEQGKTLKDFTDNPNATQIVIGHGSNGFMITRNGAGGFVVQEGTFQGEGKITIGSEKPVLLSYDQIANPATGMIRQLQTANNAYDSVHNYLNSHATDNPLTAGGSPAGYQQSGMGQPNPQGMSGFNMGSNQAKRTQDIAGLKSHLNLDGDFNPALRNQITIGLPYLPMPATSASYYRGANFTIVRTGQDEYAMGFSGERTTNGNFGPSTELYQSGLVKTNGQTVKSVLNTYADAHDDYQATSGLYTVGQNPAAYHKQMSDTYKPTAPNEATPAQAARHDYSKITPPISNENASGGKYAAAVKVQGLQANPGVG